MEIDLNRALLVGAACAATGYGVAYFVFQKLISERYGKTTKTANRIFYWCGFIGMLGLGQGLSKISYEVYSSIFFKSVIDIDQILRGLIVAVVFPILMAVVGFVLSMIFNNGVKTSNVDLAGETEKSSDKSKFPQLKPITLIVVVGVVGVYLISSQSSNLTPRTEKTFSLSDCRSCNYGDCKDSLPVNTLKVTLTQVLLFNSGPEGVGKIISYPIDNEMKCVVLSEQNFAFDCRSMKVDEIGMKSMTVSFNGRDKFNIDHKWKSPIGEMMVDSQSQCSVR